MAFRPVTRCDRGWSFVVGPRDDLKTLACPHHAGALTANNGQLQIKVLAEVPGAGRVGVGFVSLGSRKIRGGLKPPP
jgi:hypothetical protein